MLAQLFALVLSVGLLRDSWVTESFYSFGAVWGLLVAAHVGFRYMAIRSVHLPRVNLKRAKMLAATHVKGRGVGQIDEVNMNEQVLRGPEVVNPQVTIGCSLQEALISCSRKLDNAALKPLLEIYAEEEYVLTWFDDRAYVVCKKEISAKGVLRAVWQAAWLSEHYATATPAFAEHGQNESARDLNMKALTAGDEHSADSDVLRFGSDDGMQTKPELSSSSSELRRAQKHSLLKRSHAQMCDEFHDFIALVEEAGWEVSGLSLVPQGEIPLLVSKSRVCELR